MSIAWIAIAVMILIGTLIGAISGVLIQYFDVQPFIATLAMMFLARGLASMLSTAAATARQRLPHSGARAPRSR